MRNVELMSDIAVKNHIKTLSIRFQKMLQNSPDKIKGKKLYALQVEYMYNIQEIVRGPRWTVEYEIDKCHKWIDGLKKAG